MENSKKVIEVNHLRREYITQPKWFSKKKDCVTAVEDISFSVETGEIFGLLGENGAGKTTTIKMLITLLAPTKGECKVLGFDTYKDAEKIRPHINFVFGGEMGVYRRLSARDNLLYFAGLYKIKGEVAKQRTEEVLRLVELTEVADRLVETYSKGMIQRLQIARGLMNDPQIIFMDEPTVGLDPMGANILRDIIRKMKAEGRTILLTTHYMQEAEELCDHIAIMHKGNIVINDTPETIKKTYCKEGEKGTLEEAFLAIMKEGKG